MITTEITRVPTSKGEGGEVELGWGFKDGFGCIYNTYTGGI